MKLTNKLNLPTPFVDAVNQEYRYKDKQYSVTSLLKGTCQTILERRHQDNIEQDVADMVWMIFGSAVHSLLEHSREEQHQLKENHLTVPVGDYILSGIFDLYDEKEKKVTDYKTGTVWKVIYDEFDDYRKQLLMYAWMLQKIGFECDNGEIVMFLKDHSKTKAVTDPDYPEYPVYTKSYHFAEKDFADIEAYIKGKFAEISRAEILPDDQLPTCSEEERWHKDDKFAVMKQGRKTAVKLFTDQDEAQERANELGKGYFVEFRPGEDGKCEKYCPVNKYCPFYQKCLSRK